MHEITAHAPAQELERYLDEVFDTDELVVISHPSGKGSAVLVSERDCEGLKETLPTANPASAARLLWSIRDADEGRFANVDYDKMKRNLAS